VRTSTRDPSLAGEAEHKHTQHGALNERHGQISKQMKLHRARLTLCKVHLPLYMRITLMHKRENPARSRSTFQEKPYEGIVVERGPR